MIMPVVDNNAVALKAIRYPRDEFLDVSCIAPPQKTAQSSEIVILGPLINTVILLSGKVEGNDLR
jgi:hypothetical protein